MRADEWSGTLALVAVRQQQHDAGVAGPTSVLPAEMYSSMTDWAPLTKSPNCASHRTSASGRSTE